MTIHCTCMFRFLVQGGGGGLIGNIRIWGGEGEGSFIDNPPVLV